MHILTYCVLVRWVIHCAGEFEMLCLLYPIFIGSKSVCQIEEGRLINDESIEDQLINEDSNGGSDTCDQESIADRNVAELADSNKDNTGKKRSRRKMTDKEQFILKTGKVPLRNIPLSVSISLLFICAVYLVMT